MLKSFLAQLLEETQQMCLLEKSTKWVQNLAAGSEKPTRHPSPSSSQYVQLYWVSHRHKPTWPTEKREASCKSKTKFPLDIARAVFGLKPFLSCSLLKKKYIWKMENMWKSFVFLNIEKVFISSPTTLSWTTFIMSFLGLMAWFVRHPTSLINTVKIELSGLKLYVPSKSNLRTKPFKKHN